MQGTAATVKEYLAALPEDRRAALQAVRELILTNLDKDYEEGMQYGMIGYYVPHSVYPAGYHCDPRQPLPFCSLASRKDHMSIGLMFLYVSPDSLEKFQKAWAKTGKKLNMGKACLRFKKLDDLAIDLIGQTIKSLPARKLIECYESAIKAISKAKPKATRTKRPKGR